MDIVTILKIVSIVLGALSASIIPLSIKLASVVKARKTAKTEAEKEVAKNAIIEVIKTAVVEAENLYKDINTILKSQGKSAGAVKKDSVISKVQTFALENGIKFDAEFVSTQIDNIVALTKQVNAK